MAAGGIAYWHRYLDLDGLGLGLGFGVGSEEVVLILILGSLCGGSVVEVESMPRVLCRNLHSKMADVAGETQIE